MFPEIRFSENFSIQTYILTISILYCFLLLFVTKRAKKMNLTVTHALDLAFVMMASGFLGARLVHVFYEAPEYYALDWTRVFRFWEGGFVFYGGFLAAFFACWLFVHFKKLPFFKWADFYAPVLALGYGLGRISCFLAGCCYGRVCDFPWAVVFPWDTAKVTRHPVQIYAVIWELTVFALLLVLEKKPGRPVFVIWLALHSVGRLMMEYFRDDFRGQFVLGLSFSTWISLALLSSCIGFLAVHKKFNQS